MNSLVLYPTDHHFNILLEYIYDCYPDKINTFIYNNECSQQRYEYRFRRYKDKKTIKSIIPHECDFSFTDEKDVSFQCKLEVIYNEGIPKTYQHRIIHEG